MKRLGKIYEDEEITEMRECGVSITDHETDEALEMLRRKNRLDCAFCDPYKPGCCPEKTKAMLNGD